ncbi:MAG: hypothetical protein ACK5H2_10545 [Beutenbergiaceae bacterium]
MSQLSDTLAALAVAVGQFLRLPTAFLLTWAAVIVGVLGLQTWGLLAPEGGPGLAGTALLLGLLVLLVAPVLVLAIRRRRWLTRSVRRAAGSGPVVASTSGSAELVTIDSLGDRIEDQMRGQDGEADVQAVMDAFTELQLPPTGRFARISMIGRVFGRIERAQRALLTAAGGPAHAPYLADDLRITVAALVGTLVTILVGGVGIVVLGIVLLAR